MIICALFQLLKPYFLDRKFYDPENEATGLFRGFLLVQVSTLLITFHYEYSFFSPQVYCHIFTVPASAMNPKNTGGTKDKARLFKIMAVTGRTIAYAYIQASSICIDYSFLYF